MPDCFDRDNDHPDECKCLQCLASEDEDRKLIDEIEKSLKSDELRLQCKFCGESNWAYLELADSYQCQKCGNQQGRIRSAANLIPSDLNLDSSQRSDLNLDPSQQNDVSEIPSSGTNRRGLKLFILWVVLVVGLGSIVIWNQMRNQNDSEVEYQTNVVQVSNQLDIDSGKSASNQGESSSIVGMPKDSLAVPLPSVSTSVPSTVLPVQPTIPPATIAPPTAAASDVSTSIPSPTKISNSEFRSKKYGLSLTHPSRLSPFPREGKEYSAYGAGDSIFVTALNDIHSNDVVDYGDSLNYDVNIGLVIINRGQVSINQFCPCYKIDYEWNRQNGDIYFGSILYLLSFPNVLEIELLSDSQDWEYLNSFADTVFSSVDLDTSVVDPLNVALSEEKESDFELLSKSEITDVLTEVFWNSLDVLGDVKATTKPGGQIEVVDVNYVEEAITIFETTFYLLMGTAKPSNIHPVIYNDEDYDDLTQENNASPEAPAWCCIRRGSDWEMVIRGELPFPFILAAVSHETGHGIHRTRNRIFDGSGEIGALKEAIAFAYETAIMRKLGEYTGLNTTRFPIGYTESIVTLFDSEWIDWRDHISDPEEEHDRGRALLWLMIFHDPELIHFKEEIELNRILSPESLIELADILIMMKRDQAIDYVSEILTKENLFEAKSFIKQNMAVRNTSDGGLGLLERSHSILFQP